MDRTYVVTGAGSGIGRKTVKTLRERGHFVIGVDLREAEITADLATRAGRQAAVTAAIDATGGAVDGVIACAGTTAPNAVTAAVNYFGMTEFLTGLRPVLARVESPRAVLVSSITSVHPHLASLLEALLADDEEWALALARGAEDDPQSSRMIYATTKRAVSLWVRRKAVTQDWAGSGIPLNAVAPGSVKTPMMTAGAAKRKRVNAIVPMPLNSHAEPESIANLLAWLTSPETTHCCGQTIYCDGGAEVELRGKDAWSWADSVVEAKFEAIATRLAGEA